MRSRAPTSAERPPERHTLVHDGDCEFCSATAKRIQRLSRTKIDILPFDQIEGSGLLTSITAAAISTGVHFITPGGVEYHDGEAAVRAFRLTRRGWAVSALNWPGLSLLRDLGYRLVAANRGRIWAAIQRERR